jgi:hypothetical protein
VVVSCLTEYHYCLQQQLTGTYEKDISNVTYPDPNQAQQGYYPDPAQQQGYPPAQPQAPQYPGQPQPGYYPGQPQQAPPQQGYYPNQAPPQQPPAQELPRVGLDDFLSQPALGFGPGLSTKNFFRSPGQAITVQVARDVTHADVRADLDAQRQVRRFPDGRVRTVLVIPVIVPELNGMFPGGQATVWAKGQMWAEMTRAMSDAGVPPRADMGGALIPEAGARMTITLMGKKATGGGFNEANVWQVTYFRPQDGNAPQVGTGQAAQPQQFGGYPQAQPGGYAPPQQPAPFGTQQAQPQYPVQQQQPQPAYQAQQGYPQQGYPQQAAPQPQPQNAQLPGQAPAPSGMAGPAAQVAAATQAGVQAAQQAQAQAQPAPQPQPGQPLPGMTPRNADLLAQLTSQPAAQ